MRRRHRRTPPSRLQSPPGFLFIHDSKASTFFRSRHGILPSKTLPHPGTYTSPPPPPRLRTRHPPLVRRKACISSTPTASHPSPPPFPHALPPHTPNHTLQPPHRRLPLPHRYPPLPLHSDDLTLQFPNATFLNFATVGGGEVCD